MNHSNTISTATTTTLEKVADSIFVQNTDEQIRYAMFKKEEAEIHEARIKAELAELAESKSKIAEQQATLAEQKATIAENEATIADQEATIADLRRQLAELKGENK